MKLFFVNLGLLLHNCKIITALSVKEDLNEDCNSDSAQGLPCLLIHVIISQLFSELAFQFLFAPI